MFFFSSNALARKDCLYGDGDREKMSHHVAIRPHTHQVSNGMNAICEVVAFMPHAQKHSIKGHGYILIEFTTQNQRCIWLKYPFAMRCSRELDVGWHWLLKSAIQSY